MSNSRIRPTSLVLFAGKAHAMFAAFKRDGGLSFRRPLEAVFGYLYPINVLIMSDSRIRPTSLVLFVGKAHATSAALKRDGIINFRRPLGL